MNRRGPTCAPLCTQAPRCSTAKPRRFCRRSPICVSLLSTSPPFIWLHITNSTLQIFIAYSPQSGDQRQADLRLTRPELVLPLLSHPTLVFLSVCLLQPQPNWPSPFSALSSAVTDHPSHSLSLFSLFLLFSRWISFFSFSHRHPEAILCIFHPSVSFVLRSSGLT
ncbi:hypothetical protein ASPWEDRAFT_321621 [Aspergillus wentii DTO 134E9]|uniref:Uncharacterized protein n=1 Tax=Aspergillus wentii DTO 134E9 TaxID=1073089 RepID=A0A1L9RU52_ASPWE|nr:uncharacterized protein ASPWEDRAFT_321621 [Aspergillus wentii DTO 134E9]OJJ38398.1 hypothetical protein ASPWEDRAFT_321621 [Aspergillus wentii DTO 134E9]